MIHNFEVKNYRGLKHLKLENLARVNLFAGKNNVGKTAVLEAISLYTSDFNLEQLAWHLKYRGYSFQEDIYQQGGMGNALGLLKSIINTSGANSLEEISLILRNESKIYSLKVGVSQNSKPYKKHNLSQQSDVKNLSGISSLAIYENGNSKFSLDIDKYLFEPKLYANYPYPNQYIPSSIYNLRAENLYDQITLTDKEDNVIQGLQIFNETIAGLSFVNLSKEVRVPKVKMNGNSVFLNELGDGVNRLLFILLNLVNSENGNLFIDEIENGLHYTVQEKLWEIIFKLSKGLNVQVFATTHSYDCIKAFSKVANLTEEEDGKLIRLQNREGIIEAVSYDEETMHSATFNDIEVR